MGMRGIKYLVVGGWNTLFGYLAFLLVYKYLSEYLPSYVVIGISYVFSITNAYLCYRYFVFKSTGNWLREYLRFYVVYGGGYVINILLYPIFMSYLMGNHYLVQGLITVILVLFSYFFHSVYSFSQK